MAKNVKKSKGKGSKNDFPEHTNSSMHLRRRREQTTITDEGDTNRKSMNSSVNQKYTLGKKSHSAGVQNYIDRENIVLWKRPIITIIYLGKHKTAVTIFLITIGSAYYGYYAPGPHQRHIQTFEEKLLWCAYWVGLGILSSVGLGTGLHTFLLYLGPHIAKVTMAAYECNSLDFPEPPYPNEIICPNTTGNSSIATVAITLWSIVSKVRVEAFCWGAGTAIGELPPYFMARAAKLSGEEPDDEEYKEFKQLVQIKNKDKLPIMDRIKLKMENIVTKAGFFGILIFASIPNPLFDLAGITCGHFLIPFWTFFGATLIGKAIIKMHFQMLFVIIAFSEHHIEDIISKIKLIPTYGVKLQAPLKEFFNNQKKKLHRVEGSVVEEKGNILAIIMQIIVTSMILWFVISIVNSLAQNYHKRLTEKRKKKTG
ncbi:Vacuole membrane protein 1 [Strongyloides ratti]|uniref:Vacuole membrane protein 1 n=1 Tax=Strongyloides ratti TaxID=34506 RepID=A0A090LAJ0_STRRB|nr:Vacuole membrane protein 1 [Strongyloides ratti]CEF65148.1 Vacuole membrane protein 1 [Strongyloides ratti]